MAMSHVLCPGCGKWLSGQQARAHRRGAGPHSCQIAVAYQALRHGGEDPGHPQNPGASSGGDVYTYDITSQPQVAAEDWVEDTPGVDYDGEAPRPSSPGGSGSMSEGWEAERDEEAQDSGDLGAEEVCEILMQWDQDAMDVEQHMLTKDVLTEADRNSIWMFALRLSHRLTRQFHEEFRTVFAEKIQIHSLYVIHRRMATLSGIKPEIYDCCPASCCAYTGSLADAQSCPYCRAARFNPQGKRQASFEYLPLIPRLQVMFENDKSIARLRYRTERVPDPDHISNIFDGSLYKSLQGKRVVVEGVEYDHCFFQDWRDIPTGLLGDGFQLFKRSHRGHSTAWPFILINYGLAPDIRTHIEHVIPLCIAPGPKAPKDFNSFLFPFSQEAKQLAVGVWTFDSSLRAMFPMRSYNLTNMGDMIAICHMQYMKGPNALSPCRTCRIQGFRDINARGKVYYVPLRPPIGSDAANEGYEWDPYNLPMRTDEEIVHQLAEIRTAPTQEARKRKAMAYGLNGDSILFQIPLMSRTQSFPHDGMHLLFENHVPNMVKLWKGTYTPHLDEGHEEYVIDAKVWERIGRETSAAAASIPSAFIPSLPDIWVDSTRYTAEMWSFWFIYLAPHLLKNRFPRPKYYYHMLELVHILKLVLQFTISHDELLDLRSKIIHYVETYEKYYYQYKYKRLTTARLTVHALLHIPDDIERTGPVWVNWAFVMERFCGLLLPAVKSKRKPYASLNQRTLQLAQLTQIIQRFDLANDIPLRKRRGGYYLSSHETLLDSHPDLVLRWPKHANFPLDQSLKRKLAAYFSTMLTRPTSIIMKILPSEVTKWGKFRISDGGDAVRGRAVMPHGGRDNSFIKYALLVDKNARMRRRAPEFELRILYGQVHFVLQVQMPKSAALGLHDETTHLLGLVQPCKTNPEGGDASLQLVSYETMGASSFINLDTVRGVVGRIRIADHRWGLVDRSGDYVRTTFEEVDEDEMS